MFSQVSHSQNQIQTNILFCNQCRTTMFVIGSSQTKPCGCPNSASSVQSNITSNHQTVQIAPSNSSPAAWSFNISSNGEVVQNRVYSNPTSHSTVQTHPSSHSYARENYRAMEHATQQMNLQRNESMYQNTSVCQR